MITLPGSPVGDGELEAMGFRPHELTFSGPVKLTGGIGIEWRTLGDVPDSPGLYAFTLGDSRHEHVAYVGRTKHLWMVTKGLLPRSGGARGGQRYGRPRHAGITRQRINILVGEQVALGSRVRHWVRPLPIELLVSEEERLIRHWELRRVGWNRR